MASVQSTSSHLFMFSTGGPDFFLLTLVDSIRAAYYVAFGPHGPRAPVHKPGDTFKIIMGTAAVVAVAGVLTLAARSFGTSFVLSRSIRCSHQDISLLKYSCTSFQDYDQGVARGFERACPRGQARPYLWCVFVRLYVPLPVRTQRYASSDFSFFLLPNQVSPPRATRARASCRATRQCRRKKNVCSRLSRPPPFTLYLRKLPFVRLCRISRASTELIYTFFFLCHCVRG
jgi:hypothetical protein